MERSRLVHKCIRKTGLGQTAQQIAVMVQKSHVSWHIEMILLLSIVTPHLVNYITRSITWHPLQRPQKEASLPMRRCAQRDLVAAQATQDKVNDIVCIDASISFARAEGLQDESNRCGEPLKQVRSVILCTHSYEVQVIKQIAIQHGFCGSF